ncbi:MAG TPA: serine/threonine-protein kinase [Ktedonobacteraceae bacterium]|nr:serine/threonine-protein kinase [Ktedonobacteraceae bacterium]
MSFCCINQHANPSGKMWCGECGSLVAGARLGDYEIVSFIGRGSSSAVYLAHQLSLNNRKVVVKVLPPFGSNSDVADFRREAALLASLTHPYIVPIHTYGIVSERHQGSQAYSPYLVLPYVEQGSLEEIFMHEGRNPWSLNRVVPIMEDAAEALEYAHSRGMLHRDVKPANLLLSGSHVLLADFGVAALIDINMSHLTAGWAGSPAFMAPEVWLFRPGRYSDQYALAVTCYYLLAGKFPWRNATGDVRGWSHLHRYMAPDPIHLYRPDLPREVGIVLQHALAKNPHVRYPTTRMFAADLRAAMQAKAVNVSVLNPTLMVADQPAARPVQLPAPSPIRLVQMPAPPPVRPLQMPAPHPARSAQMSIRAPVPPVMIPPSPPQTGPIIGPIGVPTTEVPLQFPGYRPDTHQGVAASVGNAVSSMLTLTGGRAGWEWYWLALNLVVCALLTAQAWMHGGSSTAESLLLAVCPCLVIGPLVAFLFQDRPVSSYWRGAMRGMFLGLVDALISSLLCYSWTALWLTFGQWGQQWQHSGDGLGIFEREFVTLAPQAVFVILSGSVLMLLGGMIIGLFTTRR